MRSRALRPGPRDRRTRAIEPDVHAASPSAPPARREVEHAPMRDRRTRQLLVSSAIIRRYRTPSFTRRVPPVPMPPRELQFGVYRSDVVPKCRRCRSVAPRSDRLLPPCAPIRARTGRQPFLLAQLSWPVRTSLSNRSAARCRLSGITNRRRSTAAAQPRIRGARPSDDRVDGALPPAPAAVAGATLICVPSSSGTARCPAICGWRSSHAPARRRTHHLPSNRSPAPISHSIAGSMRRRRSSRPR